MRPKVKIIFVEDDTDEESELEDLVVLSEEDLSPIQPVIILIMPLWENRNYLRRLMKNQLLLLQTVEVKRLKLDGGVSASNSPTKQATIREMFSTMKEKNGEK